MDPVQQWCPDFPIVHFCQCNLYPFFISDITSTELWSSYSGLQDPRLGKLAEVLLGTVLASRADSTTRKYLYAFQRWRSWIKDKKEIALLPIQPYQFALFLQHIGDTTGSKSAVEEALNAAVWVHQISGLQNISLNPLLRAVVGGLQRKLARPKCKKQPITQLMLEQIADSMT